MSRQLCALWTVWAFLLALTAPQGLAWADDPAPAETATETASEAPAAAPEQPTVPLETGAPAPYDGYLMTEARLLAYTGLQIQLKEAQLNLESLRESAKTSLANLQVQLEEARVAQEPGFFQRNGLVIGFIAGLIGAGLVVWAAVSVLDTQKTVVVAETP